jgi:hypothetical protein
VAGSRFPGEHAITTTTNSRIQIPRRAPGAGRVVRPLIFAGALAALGASPFLLLAVWLLRAPPVPATTAVPVAPPPPRTEATRLRARLSIAPAPIVAAAPQLPEELESLLAALVEVGPTGADEEQRRQARALFGARLDGEGRGALEGSVDRFVTAMQELAGQLADPEIGNEQNRDARGEIVENVTTSYRRAIEELDALHAGADARPLLATQLPPETRAALQRLAHLPL